MQAGELRDRVGFYARIEASNGAGATQGEFEAEPQITCAAKIKSRLGGEVVVAGRLQGQNTVNITVRSSIKTRTVGTDWMVKDERTEVEYAIRSIVDPYQDTPQRGQYLELLCQSGAAA